MERRDSNTTGYLSFARTVYRFKIILVGDVCVGKTSIVYQFFNSKFASDYVCTLAVDLKSKTVVVDDSTTADLQIWDTCGQEIYKTITRQYYRDSQGTFCQ
jgi:small GTP-binding protein